MPYDADAVARHFDTGPEFEWNRLSQGINGRIRHAVHRRYVHEALASLDIDEPTVLDVGSGPGRFAIDAMSAGARVTLVDISEGQLDQARARIEEVGLADQIDAIAVGDVLDLSRYEDHSFDVVLCLGGPLSYVRDDYPRALAELLRVTRHRLVVSVMSLYGALRLLGPLDAAHVFEQPDDLLPMEQVHGGEGVMLTPIGSPYWHLPMALFTGAGLRHAIEAAGGTVVQMASANPLVVERLPMANFEESAAAEAHLTTLEVALSDRPGLLDAGEHLIAIVEP